MRLVQVRLGALLGAGRTNICIGICLKPRMLNWVGAFSAFDKIARIYKGSTRGISYQNICCATGCAVQSVVELIDVGEMYSFTNFLL
jgi:hypothetical protein